MAITPGDEVSCSLIIPGQQKFILLTSTYGPENGFNLQLFDFTSLSTESPNAVANPLLITSYYEREINMKPASYM